MYKRALQLGRLWALFLAICAVTLNFHYVQAASAIYMDQKSLTYAFRYGQSDVDHRAAAKDYCRRLGGTNCGIVANCKSFGYAAIARDIKQRAIAGICGQIDQAAADEKAVLACQKSGGGKDGCVVSSRFYDNPPSAPIDQTRLRGHWAENCRVQTYAFSFVAPAMFEIANCRCKLFQNGKCQLRRCNTEKGFFAPGKNSDHYVNPTFSREITQLSKNSLRLKDVEQERLLHRCPGQ